MASKLIPILLIHGQAKLAEALQLSQSELSRKINGENGWKLDDLEKALDFVDVSISSNDSSVVIDKDEYAALQTLAKKWFTK